MEDFNKGHRKRIKQKYRQYGSDSLDDYELLEILLTYSIPRRDVKNDAKQLLASCGNLYNVMNTSIENLEKIDGVGENTAILINLAKEINKRANKCKNEKVKRFDTQSDMLRFFINYLSAESNEKIIVVTLDNANRIIKTHQIAEGTANFAVISPRKIMEVVIADNASSAVIAHNHPNGLSAPSAYDINFTLKLRDLLNTVSVRLIDHIIVGEDDALSMRSIKDYSNYFDKTDKQIS